MTPFDPITDPLGWWRNQADLHPPENPQIATKMDNVRGWYRSLGELLIEELPPGPDRTVALRSLKSALMDSIGAIACNQSWYARGGVIEADGPVHADAARRIKADWTATPAADHPTWPDGSLILVGQAVEVTTGDGWSGVIACVQSRGPIALIADDGVDDRHVWCRPDELIRRGCEKAGAR